MHVAERKTSKLHTERSDAFQPSSRRGTNWQFANFCLATLRRRASRGLRWFAEQRLAQRLWARYLARLRSSNRCSPWILRGRVARRLPITLIVPCCASAPPFLALVPNEHADETTQPYSNRD